MVNVGSANEHLVEAENLTKVFDGRSPLSRKAKGPGRIAVDRVNLQLHEGEIFGLVGPNGAGKTTLIKLLTTMLMPTSGSARIAGLDIVKDEYQVRRIVGLVTSNERSFYWRLTARQNLEFFASLYNIPKLEAKKWIAELFDLLDLSDRADDRFDAYSTGMKQRLAFARGLLGKPRFLFMDEPTKGVDPIASASLIQILQERIIEKWRPTILITSHNLSEIERLCGRIALMAQGRILAVGTLNELRSLVAPVHEFHITVRDIDESRLKAMASSANAMNDAEFTRLNGTTDVRVQFKEGSDGFSRFVRSIVEAQGQVLDCTAVKATFDNVFHQLVAEDHAKESQP